MSLARHLPVERSGCGPAGASAAEPRLPAATALSSGPGNPWSRAASFLSTKPITLTTPCSRTR
eukprot:13808170-Alexandrium_andersonii.AAC.1